jgi:hypothetical protein
MGQVYCLKFAVLIGTKWCITQEDDDMKVTAWKKYVLVGALAVSLIGLPLVAPAGAQQQNMPPTDTRSVDVQDDNDFPWGLLGLLGLIGLTGRKRRHDVVDRRHMDEPVRR